MSRDRLLTSFLLAIALGACAAADPQGEALDSDGVTLGTRVSELNWPAAGFDTLVTSMTAQPPGVDNRGCWDMSTGTPPNFLSQHPCHGRNHQLFRFEWAGSGFRIKSKHSSSLCLTSPGAASQRATFTTCTTSSNQVWIVHQTNDNSSTIRPWGAPSLCLDVAGGVPVTAAAIQLFACHGNPNQQWQFHTYLDSDGLSCGNAVSFGGPAPTVFSGTSAAFRVTSPGAFSTLCAFGGTDTVHCDEADTNLLVVDRLGGSGGFTVRCFHTDAETRPNPPPRSCSAPQVCCSGTSTSCTDCRPSGGVCQ